MSRWPIRSTVVTSLVVALCVIPANAVWFGQDASGQISGALLDSSRRAVADARVTLRPVNRVQSSSISPPAPAGTAPRNVLSATNGTFLFTEVPPGEYTISVSKVGYLFSMYGMQSSSDELAYFDLRPGEKATGVTLRLWEGGTMAGTVRSASGSVLSNRSVQLLEIRNDGIARQLQSLKPPVQTNDQGKFQFDGLAAGQYLVRTSTNSLGMLVMGSQDLKVDSSAIYYPNSAFPVRNAVVTLQAADQRSDIDITIPDEVRGYEVAGRVAGLPSTAFERTIRLVVDDAASELPPFFELASAPIQSDGRFTFTGVPPGRYRLRAFVSPGSADDGRLRQVISLRPEIIGTGNPGDDERTAWINQSIAVLDQSLIDLQLQAMPGIRITGKISLTPELTGNVSMTQVSLYAQSLDGWKLDGMPLGWVEADGTFVGPALPPGRFLLRQRYARFWQFESVIWHNQNLTDLGIAIESGDVTGVEMVLTSRLAELTGRVTDNTGQLRLDAYVMFVRDNGAGRPQVGARVGRIRPNRFGDYSLQMTAGSYLVMAIAGDVPLNWRDPEFVQSLIPKASVVTLSRAAVTKQNLEARVFAKK